MPIKDSLYSADNQALLSRSNSDSNSDISANSVKKGRGFKKVIRGAVKSIRGSVATAAASAGAASAKVGKVGAKVSTVGADAATKAFRSAKKVTTANVGSLPKLFNQYKTNDLGEKLADDNSVESATFYDTGAAEEDRKPPAKKIGELKQASEDLDSYLSIALQTAQVKQSKVDDSHTFIQADFGGKIETSDTKPAETHQKQISRGRSTERRRGDTADQPQLSSRRRSTERRRSHTSVQPQQSNRRRSSKTTETRRESSVRLDQYLGNEQFKVNKSTEKKDAKTYLELNIDELAKKPPE